MDVLAGRFQGLDELCKLLVALDLVFVHHRPGGTRKQPMKRNLAGINKIKSTNL